MGIYLRFQGFDAAFDSQMVGGLNVPLYPQIFPFGTGYPVGKGDCKDDKFESGSEDIAVCGVKSVGDYTEVATGIHHYP